MAMSESMGKMIGPLPMGAWLAVVGGGLGVAYYSRQKAGAAPATPVANDPVGTGGSGMWSDLTVPSTGVGSTAAPTTNDEWAIKAIRTLIGLGYPAINSDQAIRRYVAGEALAPNESVMVNAAIAAIGPTPQVLPPPTTGIPTGPPPTPKPTNNLYRYHTVKITENIFTVAANEKVSLNAVWQGNWNQVTRLDGSPGILASYGLHHGMRLVIPTGSVYNKGFRK